MLMLGVAMVSFCFGVATTLGVVLGTYSAILVCAYFIARRMSRKSALLCIVACAVLAFIAFGMDRRLRVPATPGGQEIVHTAYEVGRFPLASAAFFLRRGFATVDSPYFVFVFWLGLTLALLAGVATGAAESLLRSEADSDLKSS